MDWHHYPHNFLSFQEPSSSHWLLSPEFIGAFSGAFFAFIFGIISYRVIKRYERFVLHKDALIILERLLNEHIDLMGLNRTGAINTGQILVNHTLTHNRLITLPVRKELNTEIGSLDIANRYFSYERGVQRINIDMESMNYTLTRFEDVMIGGGVLAGENWHYIIGAFGQIPGHMDKLLKETKELLCCIRINIRKLSGKGIWYANTSSNWSISLTDEELKNEIETLEKEIEASIVKSRPSIT